VSRGLCGQCAEGTGRHLEAERGHRSGANAQEHTRDGVATRNPELANHVRESLAILGVGPSDFVARVNSWFDQTIDRVSEGSRKHTHRVTVVAAFVVVLAVQLDIIAVVDGLSIDASSEMPSSAMRRNH
jgi:hypothetical protein